MYLIETPVVPVDTVRYATCIEVSKRIRWDIDNDVIRGRRFDFIIKAALTPIRTAWLAAP